MREHSRGVSELRFDDEVSCLVRMRRGQHARGIRFAKFALDHSFPTDIPAFGGFQVGAEYPDFDRRARFELIPDRFFGSFEISFQVGDLPAEFDDVC